MSLERTLRDRYADPDYHEGAMGGGNASDPHSWGYGGGGHWQNLPRWVRSALGILGAHVHFAGEWPGLVLDLGCGLGTMTLALRGFRVRSLGVDVCRAFPYGGGHCARADALRLPLRSGSVSAVAALDIIEHFPADLQDVLFSEIRRVLAPRGMVYVTVPSRGQAWHNSSAGAMHHYLIAEPERWAAHFQAQRFEVLADGADLALFGHPFDHGLDNYPFALRAEVAS